MRIQRAVRLASAVLLATAASFLAPSPARAADERPLENAATKARVVHPGSRFTVTVDVAPAKVRLMERDEPLGLHAILERDGKFEPLGRIGGGTAKRLGKGGAKGVALLGELPARVEPGARLHVAPVLDLRLPRIALVSLDALAELGPVVSLDVVPAPNLALTELVATDLSTPGSVKVRSTVARKTPGEVGPATLHLELASKTSGARPSVLDVSLADGLPASGTRTDEVTLAASPGAAELRGRIAYDGAVATDAKDDEVKATIEVPAPTAPAGPDPAAPSPTPGAPTGPTPTPPTPAPTGPPAPTTLRFSKPMWSPARLAVGATFATSLHVQNVGRDASAPHAWLVVLAPKSGAETVLGARLEMKSLGRGKGTRAEVAGPLESFVTPGTYRVLFRFVREGFSGPYPADVSVGEIEVTATPDAPTPGTPKEPPPAPPTEPAPLPPLPAPAPAPVPAPGSTPPPTPPPPAAELPNLSVFFARPPTNPLPVATVDSVEYRLANQSKAPSPKTTITLLLVTPRGVRVLDTEDVAPLQPSRVRDGRLRVELPANEPAGPATLRLVVDRDGVVLESDETDNTAEAKITILGIQPDLEVRGASASRESAAPGDMVRFAAMVSNAGRGASPATKARFTLVDPKRGKLPLGKADVPALKAGGEVGVVLDAPIPENAAAGPWALLVDVDAEGKVDESDENDNALVVTGAITVGPPLPATPVLRARLLELDGPATADPAGTVAVRARIANEGGAKAPAFDVALYLATRERPEARREGWVGVISELARATVPAGLAARDEVARRLEGRIPPGLPAGAYHLVLIVDPEGAAGTGADRIASTPLVLKGRALVRVAEPGVRLDRDAAGQGDGFSVLATLRNDGNARSPAASVAIVLARAAGSSVRGRPAAGSEERVAVALPLDALRPGESRQIAASVKVPPGLPRGRVRVVLRLVAPGADPVDLGEASLSLATPEPGIDLVVYEGRVSPVRTRAGEGVRFDVRVANEGDGPSPAARIVMVLAEDRGQRVIGAADVPALPPKRSAAVTILGRIPRETPEGRLVLAAVVDPEVRVPQRDRDNDAAWAFVDVVGRVDRDVRLGFGPLSFDGGAPAPGRPIDVRSRVSNAGDAPVEASEVEAFLVSSTGAVRSLGRRRLGEGIAGGGALDLAERFLLPADLEPGRYVLRLLFDPDRRLPWADGAPSNGVEAPFEVLAPSAPTSAFRVTRVDAEPKPGSAGRTFQVAAMARNEARGAAPEFDVEVVLVAGDDPERPFVWLPLSAKRFAAGLAAGVETRARFEIVVPAELPPGPYRVVVRAFAAGDAPSSVAARDPRAGVAEIRVGETPPVAPPVVPSPTPVPPLPREVPPAGPASDAKGSGLPLPLAAFGPPEGLSRDRGETLRVLLAYPADFSGGAVVEVAIVASGRAAAPFAELSLPPSEAGVAAATEGRIRLPAGTPAGPLVLRLSVVPLDRGDRKRSPTLDVSLDVR